MKEQQIRSLSQDLLHNVGGYEGSNEKYTPEYGVKPILKYIPKGSIVWCPFDTKDSNYVKLISQVVDVKVVYSHIEEGKNFFYYEPDKWDIIISNPPFKNKRQFFEKALSFGKPFALLMTLAWMNDKYSKWVFAEANREMQLLMFDKRIHFKDYRGITDNRTTFSSAYYCSDLLPKQIILEGI